MNENPNSITYLISGLGADHRVFQNLTLDIGSIRHVHWHPPSYDQTLSDYCKELIQLHIDQSKSIRLIGLSFGGLVAQEIASLIPVDKVILISTMRTRKELPFKFKCLSKMPFYDALMNPKKAIEIGIKNRKKQFAIQTEKGMALAKLILEDTDSLFFKWAVKQITLWHSPLPENEFIQISGSIDPMFSITGIVNPNYIIQDGGHFMIYEKAEEISQIINAELKK